MREVASSLSKTQLRVWAVVDCCIAITSYDGGLQIESSLEEVGVPDFAPNTQSAVEEYD